MGLRIDVGLGMEDMDNARERGAWWGMDLEDSSGVDWFGFGL